MEFLNEETARTLNQCMYQLHAGIMTPRRKQISTIYSHAALTMPTAYLRLIWAFRARAARQPTSSTATMQTTHIQFSSFLSVASSLTQFILPDLTKLFGTLAMWIGQLLLMYLDFKCFVGDSLELSLLESNLYHSHHQCEQDKTVLACRVVWIHHQTVTAVLTGFCISEFSQSINKEHFLNVTSRHGA